MFWFFGQEACGILAPQPGIKSAPPALEGKVLTTGLPGKSQAMYYLTLGSCKNYLQENIFKCSVILGGN